MLRKSTFNSSKVNKKFRGMPQTLLGCRPLMILQFVTFPILGPMLYAITCVIIKVSHFVTLGNHDNNGLDMIENLNI